MSLMSRREWHTTALAPLVTWSLLETLFRCNAFGKEVKPIARQWLADVNELCKNAKGGEKIKQLEWQEKVEQLFARVDLPEFLKFIDFEKLTANIKFKEQGELSLRAVLPKVEGLPTDLVFGHQIFALAKGRSVVPHGHDNMATAFLILGGEFHGRHFDRLEDAKDFMVVKPTIDRTFKPSECSTISDFKDNVHWFTATSDTAFIFNIHVMSLKPGRTGRVYIDPAGEKLSGDLLKCKKLDAQDAYKMYG